jgi:hypothetical protein
MFEKRLHNESIPIEMVTPIPEPQGRSLYLEAANMAFRLAAVQYQDAIRVHFSDLTYINYRHLDTVPGLMERATNNFFDTLGAEEIGKGYYLQPGDKVTVGKRTGMEVRARNGRIVPDALPAGAIALVQLDEELAATHFSISLTQPHIAVIRDHSGEAGTYVQEP